ncbi:MAG: peptide chain release factor N(5)-glutamine methyltransferase [Gammaproteobacteria bacterium]|nr:peptide chain release factor N(5)-glutamine methyltransferase [Gammaproteobacteria bacterium]NIR84622.1 peptide chain release factor N(5)-glutamine methyltransferase [Gammaproteobacteria bacterium]NIR90525.1 peptide chain release factor N(5)-glutamine methyltransferase [Gammaproteobacteria bacterium]NIU05673.1 peptide chain release factor N(5)-glutamine methyltransferase [Gammaproteobacteria bacterium]NIV52812.1 peptide chain release factor N(5)-glutamine methyltransferase [Gammaproteobacter
MNTIQSVLEAAIELLAPQSDSARLDAEVLLAHVLARPRAHLYAWSERALSGAELARYRTLVQRRAAGEPVAYLIGRREFWSLDLEVDASAIIPRAETERLVEIALDAIPPHAPRTIADLGTGTGAVALAIARERPDCRVTATDMSLRALTLARRNACAVGVRNVHWVCGDWCGALANERFHLVLSNPPYVRAGDPHLVQGDVRFEPRMALLGGSDGLDAIRRIAHEARARLVPGGGLALEHGPDQGAAVRSLLQALGYAEVRTHRDLAGRERVTEAVVLSG